jgi:hypothetical protein
MHHVGGCGSTAALRSAAVRWSSCLPCLIIQTIRRDPSGPDATDDAPNMSRPDPSGADHIDTEHQATELAVWPWRCWPMPHLAVPFPAGHASGSGRFHCRLSNRPLPQCPRAPAAVAGCPPCRPPAGCGCPQATSAVAHVRTADVRRRPTWPTPQRRPQNRTPRQSPLDVRACDQVLAGRPPSAADTAAAPLSRAGDMAVASGRPSLHAPPATAVDPGRRTRCLRRQHNLDAGDCPDQGVRRTAGCRSPPDLVAVCPRWFRNCGRLAMVSGRRGPPPTPPPPAGGCCYRKRSPGRWPLVGCRHRRDARASWRPRRSPSWPRT